MAAKRISDDAGSAALRAVAGGAADETAMATAVRWTLQLMREELPGRSVELRVPPYGAIQLIAGPSHTRGTPPSVIEADPKTWLALATGALSWDDGIASGSIRASGLRADLSAHLPITSRG